ncbi:MAG: F0F1 ATP synthase subunit epsilon [Clostridia bacterium]|nr:F0F1 ATP synthase subunit epsilon [Clostridia bacterium]
MAETFELEIVTPDRKFFNDQVEMVILRTPEGEMGIMQGHIPMVVAVDIGPIRIKKDGEWREAVISEGFMEIKQEKTVILADTAEWPEEIDINRARAARERAQERLQSKLSYIEYVRSQTALSRALARLKVSGHNKRGFQ